MVKRLTEYIRKPDTLDTEATAHLRSLVEAYPYFHSARILLLHALYRQHDKTFDEELRRSALLLPDRKAIFHLIEEKNYVAEPNRHRFDAEEDMPHDEDRTAGLIDDFLASLPQTAEGRQPHAVDATQDYIGYLMQSAGEDELQPALPPVDEAGIIDKFLDQETPRIKLSASDEEKPEEQPEEYTQRDAENEVLTERLAHIYIKQGKFEKAIEIIRRLSLKYPKKNRYFADQIRFLEKLVINNNNK